MLSCVTPTVRAQGKTKLQQRNARKCHKNQSITVNIWPMPIPQRTLWAIVGTLCTVPTILSVRTDNSCLHTPVEPSLARSPLSPQSPVRNAGKSCCFYMKCLTFILLPRIVQHPSWTVFIGPLVRSCRDKNAYFFFCTHKVFTLSIPGDAQLVIDAKLLSRPTHSHRICEDLRCKRTI